MPYARCPICGQVSHYVVGPENLEEWHKKHNPALGEIAILLCFGCWKELKEGDIVRVLSKPNEQSLAETGDVGTVTAIYNDVTTSNYEIKSVLLNGNVKWIDVFRRNQVRYELKLNKE